MAPFFHDSLRRLVLAGLIGCAAASPALAQPSAAPPPATTLELSAEAGQEAANDMASAVAYIESSDAIPANLARKVNEIVAAALETSRGYKQIKTRTGSTQTYPIYTRDGRSIDSWRMRAELQFETRDLTALSELLGKLQASMAVSQIGLNPSPETRAKAYDAAAIEAIARFRQRAGVLAQTLGKAYRIVHLNVGHSQGQAPMYAMVRASGAKAAEAAPIPLEAGETLINVQVSGKIELVEP